jgi:alpha-mannosidase
MLNSAGYQAAEFLDAWRFVLLFSEHTWGAHSSVWEPDADFAVRQWEIKRSFAEQADARSRHLVAAALATRGDPIPDAVDVFNTSSWNRTDLVTVSKELSGAGDRVEEAGGAPVPSQRMTTGELAFLARDVPALGGKRYLIRKGTSHTDARVNVWGTTLVNDDYEVRVDPLRGTIASMKSRRLKREFVDASADREMNAYVYLLGDDVSQAKTSDLASLSIPESGPLVATMRMTSPAPGAKSLVREVRLVAGLDRVDLLNVVDKELVREKEGVHFAFPSAVVGGQMRLDTPWAVVRPEIDQLPGANRNFLSVQRWIDISNDRYGVTWSPVDAALIEIGEITGNLIGSQTNPDAWIHRLKPSQTFYSWVMNNHWHTNYKADQSGPVAFRYSVRAHDGYKSEAAARFGMERSQPLIVAGAAGTVPAKPLFRVESDGVLVSTLKPSDDGQSIVVRLFGASGRDERVRILWRDQVPLSMTYTDLTERPGRTVNEDIEVPAWGIVSVRIEGYGTQ